MTTYTQQLEAALETSGVTGASFAYWDGSTLYTAVAGLRNSVTGDPVTTDTVMHIGSITKVLNTVLVMQLVDDGLIALEDPIVKHLPELRLRDMNALQKITCAMLLNHTSGIEGNILEDHGSDKERIVDAIARFADMGQLHPPGSDPSYTNVAPVIAGYLVQKIRGISWYSLIKQRIYEPIGMGHAIADFSDLPRFRQSIGDLTNALTGKLVQTTRPFLAPSFAPCGTTLMTSAADLVTFARTMLNGGVAPNGARILSSASAVRMAEPTVAMVFPDNWHWGLGWVVMPGGVLHHSGGGPGVLALLYAHPESGRAVALLTNCDRGVALHPAMLDPILESWTGREKNAPKPRQSCLADSAPYVGTYEDSAYRIQVFAENGTLALRMIRKALQLYDNIPTDGQYPAMPLYPLGDNVFEGVSTTPGLPNMQVKFVKLDADGRMQIFSYGGRLCVRRDS